MSKETQKTEIEKTYCICCGDLLTYEECTVAGISLSVVNSTKLNHPEIQKVIDRYGTTVFHICNCCFLKAFGVPEKQSQQPIRVDLIERSELPKGLSDLPPDIKPCFACGKEMACQSANGFRWYWCNHCGGTWRSE